MSSESSILDNAYPAKINSWFIMPLRNKIYGNVRLIDQPTELFVNGDIYYYIFDMAYVRIGCTFYYLVLGNIDPVYAHNRQEYFAYLETKVPPNKNS